MGLRGKDSLVRWEDIMLGLAKDFCLFDTLTGIGMLLISYPCQLLDFEGNVMEQWNSKFVCLCACVFVAFYCLIISPHSLIQESVTLLRSRYSKF